jgi:hypothetical protein
MAMSKLSNPDFVLFWLGVVYVVTYIIISIVSIIRKGDR